MDKDYLALKRASTSRPSGEWNDDVVDVVCDGVVVGRIMKAAAAPMAVDARLWPARRPLADLRLRADARGGDGGVREELAVGVVSHASDQETTAAISTALCYLSIR